MKKYDQIKRNSMVICNRCGKTIAVGDEVEHTDYLSVTKQWGYFSRWDGRMHQFDLCSECCEAVVSEWKYPPKEQEVTELL